MTLVTRAEGAGFLVRSDDTTGHILERDEIRIALEKYARFTDVQARRLLPVLPRQALAYELASRRATLAARTIASRIRYRGPCEVFVDGT